MPKPKILLVDDVKLFLEIQKDLFRRDSFTLLTANGGWEALEIMGREKPDLVFMDFFMPQGRGDEACAKAKADPDLHAIPIVIVTNSKDPKDLSACRMAGCDDILFKPIDPDQFLKTSYRLLRIADPESVRVQLRVPVCFGRDKAPLTEAWSFNLGLHGMFVETDDFPPLGTELHVEITLPSSTLPLSGKARVAWTNLPGSPSKAAFPYGMGLEFIEFSQTHREILKMFLRRRTP